MTGELKFPSIQFGDRGLYKCEARNFLGFDSATVKIVVEGMKNYFICLFLIVIIVFVANHFFCFTCEAFIKIKRIFLEKN